MTNSAGARSECIQAHAARCLAGHKCLPGWTLQGDCVMQQCAKGKACSGSRPPFNLLCLGSRRHWIWGLQQAGATCSRLRSEAAAVVAYRASVAV